ncbi:MAG: flagellar hook-length control protein FliK [Bacillota bacterium]
MKILNTSSNNKKLNNIKIPKLNNVKIGDIVSAEIVEISNKKIIGNINGKLILLNDLLNMDLSEGQNLDLEIKDIIDGKIIAKPEGESFNKKYSLEVIKNELTSIGLDVNEKNIKLLNFLKKNNISFNKKEFLKINKNIKFINKLINLSEDGKINFDKFDIKKSLKQEIIKIITNYETDFNKENDKQFNFEKLFLNLKSNLNESDIKIFEKFLKNNDKEFSEFIKSNYKNFGEFIKNNDKFQKLFKNVFKSSLKNIDLEEITFLIKEKFNVNIENLSNIKNFFNENKSMYLSFEKVLKNLFTLTKSNVNNEVIVNKLINIDKFVSNEDILKLINEYKEKDYNFSNSDMKLIDEIKEEIFFIKRSKDFNFELMERFDFFNFFQVDSQNQFKDAQVFLNKKNKEGLKVYLSLKTHKIGIVKAIITYKENKLSINFIVQSKEVYNKLNKNIDQLKDFLKDYDFEDYKIHFNIKQNTNIKKDLFVKKDFSRLNLKV